MVPSDSANADICDDDFPCIGECFAECIKEELCSGIGVRLEYAPGCTVLHLFAAQCRLDFCGVVRIIINDNNAVFFAFFSENGVLYP